MQQFFIKLVFCKKKKWCKENTGMHKSWYHLKVKISIKNCWRKLIVKKVQHLNVILISKHI